EGHAPSIDSLRVFGTSGGAADDERKVLGVNPRRHRQQHGEDGKRAQVHRSPQRRRTIHSAASSVMTKTSINGWLHRSRCSMADDEAAAWSHSTASAAWLAWTYR